MFLYTDKVMKGRLDDLDCYIYISDGADTEFYVSRFSYGFRIYSGKRPEVYVGHCFPTTLEHNKAVYILLTGLKKFCKQRSPIGSVASHKFYQEQSMYEVYVTVPPMLVVLWYATISLLYYVYGTILKNLKQVLIRFRRAVSDWY
jgi:hypothetical protein